MFSSAKAELAFVFKHRLHIWLLIVFMVVTLWWGTLFRRFRVSKGSGKGLEISSFLRLISVLIASI